MLCLYTKSQTHRNIFVYSSCRSCLSKIRVDKETLVFYFKQKNHDNEMNDYIDCVLIDLFIHTNLILHLYNSIHCMMYLMKKSSSILFQFLLLQWLENESHYLKINTNSSRHLIHRIWWLHLLNLCSKILNQKI